LYFDNIDKHGYKQHQRSQDLSPEVPFAFE